MPADSKNPRDYYWLAQVARAAGETAEAEKLLRQALELSDKAPDAWLALIQLLAASDVKKAEAAITEAKSKLAADDAPFVLGPAYEMVAQPDKAREEYETLLARRPNEAAALQIAADFYARRGPAANAEACLRKLLDPAVAAADSVRSAARRDLALGLAASGDYRGFQQGLALLTEAGLPKSRDDELALAQLLATRAERRRDARSLLEKLAKDNPLSPDAQFLLARLTDADGETGRADDMILSLLGTNGRNAALISWHVQNLLRRGQPAAAQQWIETLRAVDPDSLRTVSLTARVAAKNGHADDATRMLREFAAKHGESKIGVALAFENVGAIEDAEKLLRDSLKGSRPEAVLALAEFLARHKRASEALKLCDEAWKTCTPELVAASSLAIARGGSASGAELAGIAERVSAAAEKRPDSAALKQARAELAEMRERFDEAMVLYQELVTKNPDYVPALNNLAWLLALKEAPGGESLRLIGRVLAISGPLANYLDTRAVAYLASGQPLPAIVDMKEAIRQDPAAPFYFHLAEAQLRAGDRDAAVAALREGKTRGLRPDVVHPLERDRCRQMLVEFKMD
jgi:tetratricopeptide (TPR) repeat protein